MSFLNKKNYWTRWVIVWCAILWLSALGCKLQEHLPVVFVAMTGFFLWLSVSGAIVLALAYAASLVDYKFLRSENKLPACIGIVSIFLGSSMFFGWLLSQNQTIYVWDDLSTWAPALEYSQKIFCDPHSLFRTFRHSLMSDYTHVVPLLMSVPMNLLGQNSYVSMSMLIYIIVIFPSLVFVATALKTLMLETAKVEVPICGLLLGVLFLYPLATMPALLGFSQGGQIVVEAMLLLLIISKDWSRFEGKRVLAVSLMIILAILMARSATFMYAGFLAGTAVYVLYVAWQQDCMGQRLRVLVKEYAIFALLTAGIMSVYLWKVYRTAHTLDYSVAYSAYSSGFMKNVLEVPIDFLGLLLILLAVAGGIYACGKREMRPWVLGFAIWACVAVCGMSRIQAMGVQHFSAILLPVLGLIALGGGRFVSRLAPAGRIVAWLVLFILSAVQFSHAYMGFYPDAKVGRAYKVMQRFDLAEIDSLIMDLNHLAGTEKKVYFVASSWMYNSMTLAYAHFPYESAAIPNLMQTADVDLRDGFPLQFLEARIVAVAMPVQLHLRADGQRVVSMLAADVCDDTPIGRRFVQIGTHMLHPFKDGSYDVEVKVYERMSDWQLNDIDWLQEQFDEIYPDSRAMFHDRLDKYKREHYHISEGE
ncbi:hypothetical protein [Selenomonas sp. AB3002]|uniref:hypothetical protein n=1 Tax=Selenomonas sp. AB3002 TaxID=1392502 RepID=UPI000496E09E